MSFKSSGYKSIIPKITPLWHEMSTTEPVVDREAVAYGWIIKAKPGSSGISSVMTYDKEKNERVIDQDALRGVREEAINKLMAFYNKYNTTRNHDVLLTNSIVKDVYVPERPNSKTLFYVLVDARAFDNTSEVGKYTEQLVADGSDLHTLAEDYRGFFMVNDRTDMGHRARIGEILKANNIDLEFADEKIIESWIASVNRDPAVKTSFKEGSKINLPLLSLPEPPPAAFIISIEISEIPPTINKVVHLLDDYDQKIVNFKAEGNTVENLDLQEQISYLQEFNLVVRRHIGFNDIMIPDVVNDEIHIYLNEDYEVIYVAIDKAGEKIPLLKGMPAFGSSPPFNNMRTTALLTRLTEISKMGKIGSGAGFGDDTSGIAAGAIAGGALGSVGGWSGAATGALVGGAVGGAIGGALESVGDAGITATIPIPWEAFVEEYIVPPVVVSAVDVEKLFNELLESNSVVANLVTKFQKAGYKSQADKDAEGNVLTNPIIMAKAAKQSLEENIFNGDPFMANMGNISKKMAKATLDGSAASGQRIVNGVYVEVLNRIPIEQLVRQAIDCLKKMMSCSKLIEGILSQNLMLGYSTFKLKLPPQAQYMAERAREIAQTGDYTLYDGAYSAANVKTAQMSEPGQDPLLAGATVGTGGQVGALAATGLLGPANKETTAARFLVILEYGLKTETSVDYDQLLDEVCTTLMNLPDTLGNFFKVPTMRFPDNLPVVDLQDAIVTLLEATIIELLVGVIVGMVQALLDILMAGCKEETDASPDDADYGGADMLDAIANKVGAGSIADLLADFHDSLGDDPPRNWNDTDADANTMGTCTLPDVGVNEPGLRTNVVKMTKADCIKAGGIWTPGDASNSFMNLQNQSSMTGAEVRVDISRKCGAIKSLLNDLSAVLTPAEIASLFTGTATNPVLEAILEIIRLRHVELYEKVNTNEGVIAMFKTLEKISDVGSILSQIVTISRGLGCTFESNCIREELIRDNFTGDVPERPTSIIDLLEDPTDIEPPSTFCEDKDSTIDNGLIPKDSASLLFLLKKVLAVMYDGIYMAYDAEVLRIPDSLSVMAEKDKLIPRTTLMGAEIDFDIFNFFKMQEETFTVPFPEWFPKKTVIHPDFQRLVSQGYIPADGDPQGQFGPYTTEKLKLLGILPTPFNSAPLDPVVVPEKYFIFADDSKYGLRNINKLKTGTDVSVGAANSMYFALTQPFKAGGQFKPSMFSLKFSLNAASDSDNYRNTFILQIGDIPVDPSTIPVGNQNLIPGQVTPSISFAPFSSAIYRSQLAGVTSIDREAERVIEILQEGSGNQLITPGSIPQVSVLSGFVDLTAKKGGNQSSPSLKDFVYKKMYGDMLLQIMVGIGTETLSSPLLKSINKIPIVSIIDWAPVPTDEERECDFDPHILALDTVKKRTKEAYEQYIECSPLEDEIAVAGLGRTNLSALEAAGMIGCVMTTLRAYALEQLLRSMFPVSVFAGEEFITKLTVEYIIEETLRGIKKVGPAYYEAFLEQVEFVFGLRMKEFNPFGSIPDILAQSEEIGINWMYASAAIREFEGEVTGEEVQLDEFDSVTQGTIQCDDDGNPTSINTKKSIHSAKEQMVRSRIRFLVEEQLYSVMPKLQDLITHSKSFERNVGPGVSIQVPSSEANVAVTFDDNFLNRRLPLFDIQREKGETRLAKKFEDLRTMETEELQKQYAAYLREFEQWEGNRLGNLLGGTFATFGNIASTIGTSTTCLGKALSLNMPPLTDIEISMDVMESLESVGDFGSGVVEGLGNLEGIGEAVGNCIDLGVGGGEVDLGWAGSYSSPGLVGTVTRALNVITDSPPPLETFGSGLEEGTTDRWDNLGKFKRGDLESNFQLTTENGSIILEKYIKIKRKVAAPTAEISEIGDLNLGAEASADIIGGNPNDATDESVPSEAPPEAIDENSMNVSTSLVSNFGATTASGLSVSQILCPREVENTSNRTNTPFVEDMSTPTSAGSQTNVSFIPSIDPISEQIYNIEEWEEVFADELSRNPTALFKDLYESWSFGVRLVYVAPTNEFVQVPFESEPGAASQTLKVPTAAGASSNPVTFLFEEEKINAARSYRQFEQITVEQKQDSDFYTFPAAQAAARGESDSVISGPERDALDQIMASIETFDTTGNIVPAGETLETFFAAMGHPGFQMTAFPERDSPLSGEMMADQIRSANAFQMITLERAITLFPLSEVEIPIEIPENEGLSRALMFLKVGGPGAFKDLNELWATQYMGKLMNAMKRSPGYKLLFKYCAPSHTLLSFASIYANLLNEMPETFFDGTKAELKKLFEILLNGGDYTFENEEEKQRGGNREQMAHAQANMGTDGGARKPGLFDLAVQTPKLIFKGLAEFLDPVIAPAAVIVKAGKAGKLLPKFMKKLDSNGEETEENFLMEITVGPYDLPPPMGKFNIPLPDWLQPSGYKPPHEGLYNDPSENISFEVPVMSFKDTITGGSLDPFVREKIYGLRNGDDTERELYYEFSKAVAQFNIPSAIAIVIKVYLESMNDERCADFLMKVNGAPIVPVPTLIFPGQKIDLPITPVALSVIPMDMLCGYGPGPPHTPLGYIYHGIVAAEALGFLDSDTKQRLVEKAGLENKKKPREKLCIDIDLIREEEDRRR